MSNISPHEIIVSSSSLHHFYMSGIFGFKNLEDDMDSLHMMPIILHVNLGLTKAP
jgi:hypothetical protein